MATIPSTNISLVAIQAETGYAAAIDISLTAQSQNAITAGNTINNTAPYGMHEWIGYNHASAYSNVGPDTLIITGDASGVSMTFWSDVSGDQFAGSVSFTAGFDLRFIVSSAYDQYTGNRKYVTQNFEKNADKGVYKNTSNQNVTMSSGTKYLSHFQSDLGGLDYMYAATGFDEFKFVWTNSAIAITGDTQGTFASVGQVNISLHTPIANGTWYSAGPEGNNGTYGTTINLYGSKEGIFGTGSASIGTIITLETWVRNVALGKSETKIRTQDIYLQGDATIISGGGGENPFNP